MSVVEVRSNRGWQALRPEGTPAPVLETQTIELRGGRPGMRARIGWSEVPFRADGTLQLRPMQDELLRGHVGLVAITVDGRPAGEICLVPDKLSEPAYLELRANLQRVWSDLVLDPDSVASVQGGPPPASELWRRIASPVTAILAQPNQHLTTGSGVRRLDRVRHRRELRPAVVRAGQQGRAAVTRTMERSTETDENHLVARTIELLRCHARRDASGNELVRHLERLQRNPVLHRSDQPVRRITWGMRSDPRYRQVLSVHQILQRPELAATEGPGELRLGVPALPRLYEYWVFLQVLLAAVDRYGPPEARGFSALAVPLAGTRYRLDLPRGTTVTFPGPVYVAFEPEITARGDGWKDLEYVPHPDHDRQQFLATPDVVVYRPGEEPWLTVIDAKYVGRNWVELEAARCHEKYSRMRSLGTPVVRNVLVAHPHADFSNQWSGYGHATMRPGHPRPSLALPPPVRPGAGSQ